MNIYRGIFIFIMLIIISFCTSQTLERLRQDPEQGNICRNNIECRLYEKCINRKCENSCYNLNCRSNEGCFVRNHTASCQCSPGFAYDSDHTCAKICLVDSECGEHETCQEDGKIRKCKCRAGFAIDTHANGVCRWKCSQVSDCALGSQCLNGRCVDHCGGIKCSPDEYCDFDIKTQRRQCRCWELSDVDYNGRCRERAWP